MSTESHRKDSIERSITDSFSIVLRPVAIVRGDDSDSDHDEYVYATDLPDDHRSSKQFEQAPPEASPTVHFPTQNSTTLSINDEKSPLINKGIGASTANEQDRPFSPAPNTLPDDVRTESYHYQQIKGSKLPSKDYDSLDYDICYNVPYKTMIRKFTAKTYVHMEVMRWILVGIIGLLTGIVAAFIDICVKELFKLKYNLFEQVFDTTIDEGKVILTFLVLVGFNVACALIAALLIVIEPVAAGSGIPEIKCYLNGVKVPHVTRVGTLIAKALGVLFSVAGGFFVGKEGPMIHSGAIIGAGIPQFRSLFFKKFVIPYPFFRSDRDKRDFVSSGAAAGVAAAFGAPIGGVLFSLEEGSSFWNQSLTWRTLFCCFSATFILNIILSVYNGNEFGFLNLGAPGLVDFGIFGRDKHLWNAYHLLIFIAMGAVGGLFGALFNSLNINLSIFRMKYLYRRSLNRLWRVVEAVLIVMVTTSAIFTCSMLLGTCLHKSVPGTTGSESDEITGDTTFVNETRDFFCPGHDRYTKTSIYYNDIATLMFNSQETAIKQLFHQNGAFTLPTLGIFFMLYFFVACWTYGAGIPSGLFIPCLVIGASYGRFVATVFGYLAEANHEVFGFLTNISTGTYALIGSAAFLGGVVRMTISLTVILIESTNEISYGLPIMLTVMVAKWVGDIFNEGLYDHHIELKKTPLLGWESPRRMDRLTAEDVMSSKDLCYLFPITRVGSIERVLRTTAHSGFMVVSHVKLDKVPQEHSMDARKKHRPQLYTRPSVLGECDTTELDTDQETSPIHVRIRNPPPDIKEVEDSHGPKTEMSVSYTLPRHKSPVNAGNAVETNHLILRGIITRPQLVTLLKHKVFFNEADGPESQPCIDHNEMTSEYPRYPSVFSIKDEITDTERQMLMDLSLYMNPCPYTISKEAPLPQVFNLFRTMGLRHLPVIQESGLLAGIITRHDLTHESLHEVRFQKKKRDRETKRSLYRQLQINNYDQSTTSDVFSK